MPSSPNEKKKTRVISSNGFCLLSLGTRLYSEDTQGYKKSWRVLAALAEDMLSGAG